MIRGLQQEGIFLQSSSNAHQRQISYQITSNDWELLEIMAARYKDIENLSKITKKELAGEAVGQLEAFVQQEGIENAEEVKQMLESSVVKILVKE